MERQRTEIMKSVFLDKSLGMDIREDSVGLILMGKKLRIAEVLAGDFIKLKPLTGQDEKAEKHFPSLGEGTLSGVIVECCTETGLAKKINSFIMGGVLQNTN